MAFLPSLIGFFASIKELYPLVEQLKKVESADLYIQAFEEIVNETFNDELELDPAEFRIQLSQQAINLDDLPPIADNLTKTLSNKIARVLFDPRVLNGPDVDDLTRGKVKQVIEAAHQRYSRLLYKALPADAQQKALDALDAKLLTGDEKAIQELQALRADLAQFFEDMQPTALSRNPKTTRPLPNLPLVGRDDAYQWLVDNTQSDLLIVGQPGIGKTSLLRKYAQGNQGIYFVVSDNLATLKSDVSTLQSEITIVDDAQNRQRILEELVRIRQDTEASYRIIATCWPNKGVEDSIRDALSIQSRFVRELGLLTRAQIKEIIEFVGISDFRANPLVHEIIDQAEGKPGLAVTLTLLCMDGGIPDLASGEALRQAIFAFYNRYTPSISQQAREVIASFAVGGDAGMRLEDVAEFLSYLESELRNIVATLASGGVIQQVGDNLSIRPRALREVMIRDVFFSNTIIPLRIDRLIAQAPSYIDSALALIGAFGRGAKIPMNLIQSQLLKTNDKKTWAAYAWLGIEQVRWVLDSYPERFSFIVRPALIHDPDTTIPIMLEWAANDNRPLNSSPDHSLRLLEDWITSPFPGDSETLKRRRILLRHAKYWLRANEQSERQKTGYKVLALALRPDFEDWVSDPGAGMKTTLHRGFLAPNEISRVGDLWSQVVELLQQDERILWNIIIDEMVFDWIYPGRRNNNRSDEADQVLREVAHAMIRDLLRLSKDRPGVNRRLQKVANDIRLDVDDIPQNSVFDILYPGSEDFNDEKQIGAVKTLAAEWQHLSPVAGIEKLSYFESEARIAGISWPRWTPYLCRLLSEQVESPLQWAEYCTNQELAFDLVEPFMIATSERKEDGWRNLFKKCLDTQQYKGIAIYYMLTVESPDDELLQSALELYGENPLGLEGLIWQNRIPLPTLKLLLEHKNKSVAVATAIDLWNVDPVGEIPAELEVKWRQLIVTAKDVSSIQDHWLGDILGSNGQLAYQWLEQQINDQEFSPTSSDKSFSGAMSAIGLDDRKRLLEILKPKFWVTDVVVQSIVGNDLSLFQQLLENDDLQDYHLVPLAESINETWISKVRIALNASYGPYKIILALFRPIGIEFSSGRESIRWEARIAACEQLAEHEDDQIKRLGEIGLDYAAGQLSKALAEERREDIYGIF